MSYFVKSTVPGDPVTVNPYFGYARELIDSTCGGEFFDLACHIKNVGTGMKLADLISRLKADGTYDKFLAQMHRIRTAESGPKFLGRAPPVKELYGRFRDAESIVDLGSGDGRRLKSVVGRLKVVSIDIQETTGTMKHLLGTVGQLLPGLGDVVVSSWMALPQLSTAEFDLATSFDGLHLVPDHSFLVQMGMAQEVGEKVNVNVRINEEHRVYADNPVSMVGIRPMPGYILAATYCERSIICVGGNAIDTGSECPGSAVPDNGSYFDWSDVGYKWDGEFRILFLRAGGGFLVNRAGQGCEISSTSDVSMGLHLEFMGDCFVLLRILFYRGFVPPHSGACLRGFCAEVDVSVLGLPVLGPPPLRICQPTLLGRPRPIDGIICRVCEKDYYIKREWTVDISSHMLPSLREEAGKRGIECVWPDDWGDGLKEFGIRRTEGGISLTYIRDRDDKRRATAIDTLFYLAERPLTAELEHLFGLIPCRGSLPLDF